MVHRAIKRILADLNLDGNEIKDFRIDKVDALPEIGEARVVYVVPEKIYYVCDGTQWLKIQTGTDAGTYQVLSEKDQANGYAGLNEQGKIESTELPISKSLDTAKAGEIPEGTQVKSALDSKLGLNSVVSNWSEETSDSSVPSEKLVKETLDSKTDETMSVAKWDETKVYRYDSVVVLDGALFVSLQNMNVGNNPTVEDSPWWVMVRGSGGGGSGGGVNARNFIIGDGVSKEFTVSHMFGTCNLIWSMHTNDLIRKYVNAEVYAPTTTTMRIVFNTPPANDGIVLSVIPCIKTATSEVIEFEQTAPSDTWAVAHNTGKPVYVQTFDKNGNEIEGDIKQDSATFNAVSVKFDQNQEGVAVMKAVEDSDIYEFPEPQTEWVINHGKGRYVGVQTYTDIYGQIRGEIQQSEDKNTVTILFSQPMSGHAIIV